MKYLRRIVLVALITSLVATSALAQNTVARSQDTASWTDTPQAEEMTKLNKQLTDAYLREDVKLLREMLDEQHVHNNVFGVPLTKDQFLKDIESGVLQFEEYETPSIKWHINDHTAVATGMIKAKAIRDGRVVPANTFVFTRVFVKRPTGWKVLLFHNTMARAPMTREPTAD